MKESETLDQEYYPINYQITVKEVEEKILNYFYFLKDDSNLNKVFGEYNNEENILEVWNKIIKYLYEEIFCRMAITIKDLKSYLVIKGQEPLALDIILSKLRDKNTYITIDDLKNDKYYETNFPELYPKESTQTGFFSGWIPKFEFCQREGEKGENKYNKNFCQDISKTEKIPENSILFNYEIFKQYCDALIMILEEILEDNGQKIIRRDDFINIIDNQYTTDNNSRRPRFNLRYGSHYLEIAIHYLEKTKQIIPFKGSNNSIIFIKKAKNKDDCVNEEDMKEAELLLKDDI
jgi:hypothetical protein